MSPVFRSATSGSGGSIGGGPKNGGPLSSGGQDANAGLTFTGTAYSSGVLVTPAVSAATDHDVGGPAALVQTTPVTIVVGNAAADASGSGSFDGTTLTAVAAAGSGSYANLESKVVSAVGNGGGPLLGTKATILAGTNSGAYTGGNSAIVSMSWRARTMPETSPSPPQGSASSPLVSDVLNLTGMSSAAGEPVPTDPFVLQMTYADGLLGNEAVQAADGAIFLAWLNPTAGPGGGPLWVNAAAGNFGNDATFPEMNFQGSFADFQATIGDTNVADYIGAWGVDTSNHDVWAVIDHNSQFAVVPEPSSLILVAVGGLLLAGLLSLSRRRRVRAG